MVGEMDTSGSSPVYKMFTHKKMDIGVNGEQVWIGAELEILKLQIVDVNLTSDGRTILAPGTKLDFSYEVNWKQSETTFHDRFDKYLDPSFFQHRVRLGGAAVYHLGFHFFG